MCALIAYSCSASLIGATDSFALAFCGPGSARSVGVSRSRKRLVGEPSARPNTAASRARTTAAACAMHLKHLFALLSTALAADDGGALTPPRGWRSWNQFNGAVTHDDIVRAIRGLTDRSRLVDGVPTSLADLGYGDVGIDDGWQQCGHYGPHSYRYHDAAGRPVVAPKFPSLLNLTRLAALLGLTMSWYANACGCVAAGQCCSDHCDSVECFLQDVDATLAYGFSGLKVDGCGAQRDIALWYGLLRQRRAAGAAPVLLEQCHDDDGLPQGNAPRRDEYGALWCPFHLYRVSGDAGPLYGALLSNLNATRALAARQLSLPGCWAYADMLEVGVTATPAICGATGRERCPPLSRTEARSHFGAWCVVSSPLVLSFDFTNSTLLDEVWPTVTNRDALAINEAWAGASGTLFAASAEVTTFTPCGFTRDSSCTWPLWWSWAKPLPATDARASLVAVLLMNNGDAPTTLGFAYRDVLLPPQLPDPSPSPNPHQVLATNASSL